MINDMEYNNMSCLDSVKIDATAKATACISTYVVWQSL